MDLPALIQAYGYPAVFLGTAVEGETVLLLAGFAAHRGYLDLAAVVATAVAGSALGDQLAFLAGRRWGDRLANLHPHLRKGTTRALALLHGRRDGFVFVNRFLIGLRMAGPFAVGMTDMRWHRFLAFNLAGAVLWSVLIAGLGYVVGEGLQRLLGDLRHVEEALLGVLLIAGAIVAVARRRRARRTGSRS